MIFCNITLEGGIALCQAAGQGTHARPAESEAVASAMKEFLRVGDPPIVFTLGSAAVLDPGNFYKASTEAAALLKRRAILLLGNNPQPANLPASVLAVNYARFSQLFLHASAIVHQGASGPRPRPCARGAPCW